MPTPSQSTWICGHVAGAMCAECYHQLAARAAALRAEVDRLKGERDAARAERNALAAGLRR